MTKREPSPMSAPADYSALTREVLRLRDAELRLREQNEELLENQALLEEARDDFAELYDGAPHPLLTLSARAAIRSANLAAAELFERERSWLVGRSFRLLFRELDRSRVMAALMDPAGIKGCQAQLVLPDESCVPVQLSRRLSVRKPGVAHVAVVDLREASSGALVSDADDPAREGRRILLVEDHVDTAEAMQEVLERNGYRVVSVDSVQAAVGVDLTQVDAIVSDILLPDGMGTDLLRQLKRTREVPAIAFSGMARRSEIERAKQAGFDLYLTKPVDFPRLLAALGTMLPQAVATPAHRA